MNYMQNIMYFWALELFPKEYFRRLQMDMLCEELYFATILLPAHLELYMMDIKEWYHDFAFPG